MVEALMAFHVAAALYRPGDQIMPGNWGRLVMGRGPEHAFFYREYLWERIRGVEFPARHSRLNVAYTFTNLDFAQTYREASDFVYLVSIPAEITPDRLDMSWIELVKAYRSFEGAEHCARSYWRGDERDPRQVELLVPGPLTIRERLTPIPENGTSR